MVAAVAAAENGTKDVTLDEDLEAEAAEGKKPRRQILEKNSPTLLG